MWIWFWLLFVIAVLALPLGYGWGYRRWGFPYPRYYGKWRGARAAEKPGAVRAGPDIPATRGMEGRPGLTDPDTEWGLLADFLWIALVVAAVWLVLALVF